MMCRLVTLLCVCVGLLCVESRLLKSSFRADTSLQTSITEGWRKFWEHMESAHSDMKLDFKRRMFRGAGVVGAAFYVPSMESDMPGKIIKVRFDPTTNEPLESLSEAVADNIRNSKMVAQRLNEYGVRYDHERQGKWVHHFVRGTLHHTTPRGEERGYIFELMDFVQGISFEDYIAKDKFDQTPERTGHIIRQLLEVLYVMKEARIIHGDLHPGNILIQGNGHLVVIDMDGSRVCQNVENVAARPMFIPYDSFAAHITQVNTFTSIDGESCIAFDAYSVGVGIVSGVTMKVIPPGKTSPFYYRKMVLDWLIPHNVDPMILHLSNEVSTPHGHSQRSLPPVLYRILTALLDEHRAPRTAATLAMLDQVLMKELSTVAEEEVEFHFEDTMPQTHNIEEGLPTVEDEQNSKKKKKEKEEEEAEPKQAIALPSLGYISVTLDPPATVVAHPVQKNINKVASGYVDTLKVIGSSTSKVDDVNIQPTPSKKKLKDPFQHQTRFDNGLTDYMEEDETNALSFPPEGPIVTRKGKPLRSYVPNIMFRNGLHAAPLKDTYKMTQLAVLYNIFQLQLVYRQKLVLQMVTEEECEYQTASITTTTSRWDSPVLLAVDQQVPSHEGHTARTIFEFDGQPLHDMLNHLHHTDGVNRVHGSLMNWDNHVIVGGCLREVRDSDSDSIHYAIGSSTRYFLTVDKPGVSLELHVPEVLVVGGGPMGLVAAIEARRSAAAVTIWEKRDRYTRMYCQACEVSSLVQRFGLKTEQFLKSVEETLSCVAIAIGVNLQFQREFLYVDKNLAVGKVSGDSWYAQPSTTWADLKQKFGGHETSIFRHRVDVLIAADGSGSSIRKHYMRSEFADSWKVVIESDKGDVYKQRVLQPKDRNKPIYSLATLQFFKHDCQYLTSHCIRHDTGFDFMWDIWRSSGPSLCLIEYIENWIGLKHIEHDVLAKNALPIFSVDGPDVWSQIRVHQTKKTATAGEKHAMQAFDELMFARYLSSMPGTAEINDFKVQVRNVQGARCSLTGVTEASTVATELETFTSWRKADVYSIFWLRARRADANRFAVSKDGVTAVLVGDATRDSFFPFGNGLSRHINALTDELKTEASSEPSQTSPVGGTSILGALIRGKIGVSEYNAHYEAAISLYIKQSSRALLLLTACTNEASDIDETAANKLTRLLQTAKEATSHAVQTLCPGLDVTDT